MIYKLRQWFAGLLRGNRQPRKFKIEAWKRVHGNLYDRRTITLVEGPMVASFVARLEDNGYMVEVHEVKPSESPTKPVK